MQLVPCLALVLVLVALQACASRERAAAPRKPARSTVAQMEAEDPMVLATVRSVRYVAMTYRLDLKKDNAYSATAARVLDAHDAAIRGCYTERLEAAPELKGRITFAVRFSKATGGLERIARVGGTIVDKALERCLVGRLAAMPFEVPRDMRGTLTYRFDASERPAPSVASPTR